MTVPHTNDEIYQQLKELRASSTPAPAPSECNSFQQLRTAYLMVSASRSEAFESKLTAQEDKLSIDDALSHLENKIHAQDSCINRILELLILQQISH